MGDIFISYAREDQHKAQKLATIFREQGWDVWWDAQLVPGDTWDATIQDALTTSKCVVVLWSARSVESEWVRVEAHEAKNQNLLVPASLDSGRIPLAFTLRQTVSLKGWDGSTDHPGITRLLQAVSGKLGQPAVGRDSPPHPTKWKPWLLPLSLLVLPTLLIGLGIWSAMQWRLPTPVSLTVTTTQARFQIPKLENQRYLMDQLPFQWITVEKFGEISFAPHHMEMADPKAKHGKHGDLPESAWHSVPGGTHSRVRLVKSGPRAIPSVFIESEHKKNQSLGVLESILTGSGMNVGLWVHGGNSQTLTVKLTGPQVEAKLIATEPMILYARESRMTGIESLPFEEQDNQTFRIRLQEKDSKLRVSGKTQLKGASASQPDQPNEQTPEEEQTVTLALGLSQDPEAGILSEDVMPITGIDFSALDEKTKRRKAPQVFEGEVEFGPTYSTRKPIKFNSPDFLRIEPEERFLVKHIKVDRDKGGLNFLVEGAAGVVSTGTEDVPPRDHRVTAFEWLKASQWATIFGAITWILLTFLGAYKFWKELRPDA